MLSCPTFLFWLWHLNLQSLTPEARFLLSGVRPGGSGAECAALAGAVTDWPFVLTLAQRHTVVPLLYQRLKEIMSAVPAPFSQELQDLARASVSSALLLTSELVKLLELFDTHGIPALPYKGPALGAGFYGNATLRQFNDLDVLVRPVDLPRAQALLQERGWQTDTHLRGAQARSFVRHYDSYKYLRAGVLLELHWSVVERRFAFPLTVDEMLERARPFTLLGRSILVPTAEDTLLFSCFHGAKHLWERFSWLCDVAYIIAARPDLDWDVILARTQRLGCEHALLLSLSLAQDYLQTMLPAGITRRLAADPTARALARQAASYWFLPEHYSPGNLERGRFHIKMRERRIDRLRYRLRATFRTTADDWALLPWALPGPLFFLYYPLRFTRMAGKYLSKPSLHDTSKP